MRTDMAYEEIVVTTPLKHKVKVRMKNLGDDVWDTSFFYANQVRRVGKFKGKDFAIDAATKKAIEIADAPPSTGSVICGNDDPARKKPTSAAHETPRLKALKKKIPLKSSGRKESS
jgi:hypothetical protein